MTHQWLRLPAFLCIMICLPAAPTDALSLDVSKVDKWNSGQADGVDLTVKPAGAGLALDVDLAKGDWAQIWQDGPFQLKDISGLRLNLKLSGKRNRVEIKLVDADGTNFGVRLEELAFDGEWHEIVIPFSQFVYFWGGPDETLDREHVASIWLAVSKMDGGRSKIEMDRFEISGAGQGGPSAEFDKDGASVNSAVVEPAPAREGQVPNLPGMARQQIRPPETLKIPIDRASEWESSADQTAKLTVKEKDGGLELSYKLIGGNWAQIYRELPADLQGLTAIRLKLRQRGARNRIELKMVDEDGTNFGRNFEDVPLDNAWKDYDVPLTGLTYLWGGDKDLDLARMNSIWIAVSKMDGGEGVVGVAAIELVKASSAPVEDAVDKPAPSGGGVHFDMEQADVWKAENEAGTKIKLNSVAGKDGKAVEIDYDLGSGNWLQIMQAAKMDLRKISTFQMRLKNSGKLNAVEIKLVDADGTNFGVRLDDVKASADWREITMPFTHFAYFWGGDDKMDWEHVESFWIAISRIDGGAGILAIDDIRLSP